jgi:hypothetical protein
MEHIPGLRRPAARARRSHLGADIREADQQPRQGRQLDAQKSRSGLASPSLFQAKIDAISAGRRALHRSWSRSRKVTHIGGDVRQPWVAQSAAGGSPGAHAGTEATIPKPEADGHEESSEVRDRCDQVLWYIT